MVSLRAREDLTACNWKKTCPPSSGHTIFSFSLLISSSIEPLSPSRQRTVLQEIQQYWLFSAWMLGCAPAVNRFLKQTLTHDDWHLSLGSSLNQIYCMAQVQCDNVIKLNLKKPSRMCTTWDWNQNLQYLIFNLNKCTKSCESNIRNHLTLAIG